MNILLDENLPRRLLAALRAAGHRVESVHSLELRGVSNGQLYRLACDEFDLFFTRDAGFAHNVRQQPAPARLRLLRVTLPQLRQDDFVASFMTAFRATDWSRWLHGAEWP
ncbi:MAG TPA: DUF5615 family PIN-like protein [Verrucomicrobiota bacterium]|nr:DUF5615 family PIN-like protein [Verrucomicrobiota bacterium]